MKLSENIAKFSKFVKAHPDELSPQIVQDVARAIVLADIRGRVDAGRGQFEYVTLAGLAACGIPGFSGVSRGGSRAPAFSDVMQMRIMCDVLTIVMGGDYKLAMRYSSNVAKAVGQRRAVGTYLSYAECEEILNGHCASSFDEALRPVFEKTSYGLCEVTKIAKALLVSTDIATFASLRDIWLPAEFDSHGHGVYTVMPKRLQAIDNITVSVLEAYNYAYIMSALIEVLFRTVYSDSVTAVERSIFLLLIGELCDESSSLVPIGVGCKPFREVFYPREMLPNQSTRILYARCFSDSIQISGTSLDNAIKMVKTHYKIA